MQETTGTGSRAAARVASSEQQTAAATSAGNQTVSSTQQQKKEIGPTDQSVLDYLRKKGLGNAVLELTKVLKDKQDGNDAGENKGKTESNNNNNDSEEPQKEASGAKNEVSIRERIEEEEAVTRNQRTLLAKSTGGGYGYDRDSAWPVVLWGIPDTTAISGKKGASEEDKALGVEEAIAYLDAFTAVQIWVLGLPDHPGDDTESGAADNNPVARAHAVLKENGSLTSVVEELSSASAQSRRQERANAATLNSSLPPSAKPELLAVTFALLVHTYCELLELGRQDQAHMLRDAFKAVYDPLYPTEFRDLYKCNTTDDIMRLNSCTSQYMDALGKLKEIVVKVASYKSGLGELRAQRSAPAAAGMNPEQAVRDRIRLLKQKYDELSQRASMVFEKMHDLPFLRRARAVRWQLTMSTTTYGLLASFLSQPANDAKLVMSALLQTKCELHVERRDPVPMTPACIFEEESDNSNKNEPKLNLNKVHINWAAPIHFRTNNSTDTKPPYPKFYLDDEYDDEKEAKQDKEMVEFNRSLLIHGFRRLEALERKREYEVMPKHQEYTNKRSKQQPEEPHSRAPFAALDPLEPTVLMTTLCANTTSDPLLQPISALSSGQSSRSNTFTDASAIWEESGIGLVCAKTCLPDGRRVAAGCDDSAVRVWDVSSDISRTTGEPAMVLLGHKNGFPVFDVDWGRDGRSLLSAGGDGSVRLWDTMAVGPFGELYNPKQAASTSVSLSSQNMNSSNKDSSVAPTSALAAEEGADDEMHVEGQRYSKDPVSYRSGAALAVYRGHAPGAPIWSVSFAPAGYYFASAGADATARIWTTDGSIQPVRLLCGHTASNVNSIRWHPNCNYVLTGSDDKTVRLWDIQTGRTVRLFMGCSSGVNTVQISPGGDYAAGADYSGTVHVWDMGSGKKISQFRPKQEGGTMNQIGTSFGNRSIGNNSAMIHALSFSACGKALATGGDDCCVRIWDIARTESVAASQPATVVNGFNTHPVKTFATRRTMLMDLQFNKRNLLFSVGKFVNPVSLSA